MFDIKDLNKEQLIPATSSEGAFLVTAGAGSGKTRLLTHRICYLIKEKGVSPFNILAITFTNKATNEMKERILTMIDNGQGVFISTFHSMCSRILRESISYLDGYTKNFTIYDAQDKEKIIKQLIKESKTEDDKDLRQQISSHISNAKNLGLDPSEYMQYLAFNKDAEEICQYYQKYNDYLKQNNGLDFDDLLIKTLELFKTNPQVLNKYQERFRYIHVDEFQDTNLVQYKLLKLLASKYNNIFVVGDEDQCIYGWRGANIANILNFTRDFKDVKQFKLEQNYRSTKNILNIANKLIVNNKSRTTKNLWTQNDDGQPPIYLTAFNETKEAEFVASKIYSLITTYNYQPQQIGVLMRLSAQSRLIEEKLLNYNIPYKVSGIFKFFDRQEIKNVLAYLRILVNERDGEAVLRVLNFPKRGIGDGSVDKLINLSNIYRKPILEIIQNADDYDIQPQLKTKLSGFCDTINRLSDNYNTMSLDQFIKTAIDIIGVKSVYNSKSEEDEDRLQNISQLVSSIISFYNSNDDATLASYLESVTLSSDVDDNDDQNSVSVSTIHAAKGLEFDVVFIIGAEEGKFPISRAMDNKDDMEEERRLMYVAVTRAKKLLFITSAQSRFIYGDREFARISRFVEEMGLAPKQQYDYDNSYSNYVRERSDSYTQPSYNLNTSGFKAQQGENNYNKLTSLFKQKAQQSADKYKVGMTVLHPKFGVGEIIEISANHQDITVKFAGFGVKVLTASIAPLQILK